MKKRILVVEDDAALARVLRDNFEFEGFEVEWVADGNEAINRARAFAPDLVVLDVMLPGRDGFTLCSVLRQGGRTPIVLLSARSQKADKLKGLHLGADDYVTKPFDLDELLARIHAVLRRTRPSVDQLDLGPTSVDFRRRAPRAGARDAPDAPRVRAAAVSRRTPRTGRAPRRAAAGGLGLSGCADHAVGGSRDCAAPQEDRAGSAPSAVHSHACRGAAIA